MKLYVILSLFLCSNNILYAQAKMRPAEELINREESGWKLVSDWISKAKNKVEILPADSMRAYDALFKCQVTTRSPMGAIIFNTGGLIIDDGWIRILGSGSAVLPRSLPDWNKGKAFKEFGETPAFLLIADDASGGFFLLNGGGLGKDLGKVYYWLPDNLQIEPMDLTYSEFLSFCFDNDLDKFYEGIRWEHWRTDIAGLKTDEVFNFTPPLWSKEGSDVYKSVRAVVPIQEQYDFKLNLIQSLD
jgi:hypothetical protein